MKTSEINATTGSAGQCPDVFASLSDQERELLSEMLRNAKLAQRQQLNASLEGALGVLPRLLRGTARKILFGG